MKLKSIEVYTAAGFHTSTSTIHDDYITPAYAWEWIADYVPTDQIIWEAFYGNGKSDDDLPNLGVRVNHKPINLFENEEGDIAVSNPPFTQQEEVSIRF